MTAHVIDIDTQAQAGPDGEPTGVFRYRWHCSCHRVGPWNEGSSESGAHASAARRARNGGVRHQRAMDR